MKILKKTFLLFAAVILLSANSFAQPRNVIKANLLSPFIKSGSFFYERAINDEMSLVGGFFFTNWSPDDYTSLTGYGLTFEYRYYLSEERIAPSGAFLAPFVRYQKFTVTEELDAETNEGTITGFGGGLLVGYQRLFKDRITLEAFVGPAYYGANAEVTSGSAVPENDQVSGFTIRFGVTVGVAF